MYFKCVKLNNLCCWHYMPLDSIMKYLMLLTSRHKLIFNTLVCFFIFAIIKLLSLSITTPPPPSLINLWQCEHTFTTLFCLIIMTPFNWFNAGKLTNTCIWQMTIFYCELSRPRSPYNGLMRKLQTWLLWCHLYNMHRQFRILPRACLAHL